MLDLMTKAKNAIEAYNSQLRINSSNIANMSVPGYKAMKISFQSIYENLINQGTAATGDTGGTNPTQLGSSVAIGNTSLDFSQGAITSGGNLDLGINGEGLFIVSPDGGATKLYTRAGQFVIDSAGNLTTTTGMQVYGLSGGSLVPITGLNSFHSDKLSWTNDGQLVEFNYKKNSDGTFDTSAIDPSSVSRNTGYKIALTNFTNPSGLEQASGSAFAETPASGAPLANKAPGDTYGVVSPREYEQSNVFYTGEVIDSLEAQRAMSGNLTILRMISDEISNFISRIS
jgi:flagellar hook protein FlgE